MSRTAAPVVDRETQDIILLLVKLWLEEPDRPDLVEVVREKGALPVYYGWCSTFLLRPDGEVLEFVHDEGPSECGPEAIGKESWRIIALATAARRWPQLKVLLPKRPPDARTCDMCSGGGWIRVGDIETAIGCGGCNSLGWLAPPPG